MENNFKKLAQQALRRRQIKAAQDELARRQLPTPQSGTATPAQSELTAEKAEILKRAQQRQIISAAQARQAAKDELSRRTKPQTNMLEQSMSGVNEGIAGILGTPVDLMTGALNLGARGINAVAGTDIQPITDPAGGSQDMRAMLAPTISDSAPQNAGQRFGRRIGQEVGAMAIPGGAMMRGAKAPLALGGAEVASAVGAGVAGQASQEIAPGNQTADMIASMIGGLSPVAASRALRPSPKAPTLDELQAQSRAGHEAVERSGATLSPQSSEALAGGLEGALGPRAATRKLNPKAAIAADELGADLRQTPPTLSDVDQIRQWIGKNVAGSSEAGERAIGAQMKGTIDDHLDALTPTDVTGTNRADEVVDTLKSAREKSHRIHKSEIFEAEDTGLMDQGLRRAATSGTGGNEINAIRQNVARVLKTPKLRRGFSETELQAMRDIADGTPTQNALRLIGRLSPDAGFFPMSGLAGAAGVSGATGNPLFMIPSAAGYGAKRLGERSTRKQAEQLGELIRNGGKPLKKEMSDLERRLLGAVLAKSSGQAASQLQD